MDSPYVPYALPNGTVICSGTTRYVIARVLGTGGFGITYMARASTISGSHTDEICVALKEFFLAGDCTRNSVTTDSTIVAADPARERVAAAMEDFIAEAERLKSIRGLSPNIVGVHEVFKANSTAYFAMDYLAGPSLRDYIASRHHLSEAETLTLIRPLCDAVGKLHARRIMHLDIKPGNIVVTNGPGNRPQPVLIDFGQSKHIADNGSSTRTIAAAGFTEGYAPIEQYAGITSFSPQTDVYALAATMLHALSGSRPPKATELTPDYISRALPSETSTQLRDALTKALQFQAAGRQADAISFAEDLPRGHSAEKGNRPARNRSLTWIIAGLLAACLILLFAVMSQRQSPSHPSAPTLVDSEATAAESDATPAVEESTAAPAIAEAADEPVETSAEDNFSDVRDGTPGPLMHTYNFNGYFADADGKQWPVRLTAKTDNEGRWGSCDYTNVSYGINLKMDGSGLNDRFIFHTNDKGSDLTISISYDGEGVWTGTAISGSKKLDVVLYE
ncbi:MAG: serine/threonine protein kinase [Paramuribaculum sp.]|nr:serine/threonine protein kinase [Paramuribaculum sp.]